MTDPQPALAPHDRYLHDPIFHTVVESLEHLMADQHLTPTDVEAACALAIERFRRAQVWREAQRLQERQATP